MSGPSELSAAQIERLALLAEELAEAMEVVGEILRHGYDGRNPLDADSESNRDLLEHELGDVFAAVELLCKHDLDRVNIVYATDSKRARMRKWLHHQEPPPSPRVGRGRARVAPAS